MGSEMCIRDRYLVNGIVAAAKTNNISMTANSIGGMFGLFFSSEEKVTNFSQASNCDIELFKKFYKSMIKQGVYLAPSAYECGFLSDAHGKHEIDQTINAALTTFSEL